MRDLEASETQVLNNMKASRTNYMHKVPDLLGLGNLIRQIVFKMTQADKIV